jgi:nitroreductase
LSAPEGADADKIALIAAAKIDRAPTLVVISSVRNPDPVLDTEDFSTSSIAAYLVLLGAHARGLAGYWRTPAVLRDENGLLALGIGGDEEALGLLYLGHPSGANPASGDRAGIEAFASFLD